MKKIVILNLIFWLAAAVPLPAATLLVPSQYSTIQAGIDAANDGDTVIIAPGVYTGDGNWDIEIHDKAITVQSIDPNDLTTVSTTVIDCNDVEYYDDEGYPVKTPHWGFRFWTHAGPVLNGLTIINSLYYPGIDCVGSPAIINCVISNCTGGQGGGIACWNDWMFVPYAPPQIINCTISDNMANEGPCSGGGIYCNGSSPIIINCTISNNTAYQQHANYGNGGGIYSEGSPTITNCIISGNSAGSNGGGIYGTTKTIANCRIVGNSTAGDGGGIYCGFANVSNCTIAANAAGKSGGGIRSDQSISVINSILWGNSDSSGMGQSAQILTRSGSVAFSCIQDDNADDDSIPFNDELGGNNIDDTPEFVRDPNIAGGDFGDLHLQEDSPCINTGMPNFIAGTSVDMDGQPRIIGPRIDIGADEYTPMIFVTEPKGGEVWAGGSKHQIKWDSFGVNGTVNISYSTNGGANWEQIETSDAGTGSFLWQVPNGTESNQCLLSVVPSIPDNNVICIKSGIFSINRFQSWPGKEPNGKAIAKIGPKQACVKWQFETGGPVTASITVGHDNKIYAACEDGKLYVLDADKGTLLWSYDAEAPLIASTGVSHHGMVYVGDSQGKLHALDEQGQLQWTQGTCCLIHSTPVVARNGDIYLCSEDGTLHALSQNGSELWCFDTAGLGLLNGSIFVTPQTGDDETIYLAGVYDPNLYAINPADGSIKWVCNFGPINGWPFAAPAIAEDGVLYQTLLYDSNMYAIEPQHGQIIWAANIADPCSGLFEPVTWTDSQGEHSSFEYLKYSCGWSPLVIGPDGTIYVNVAGAYLEAVNPDGTIKWAKKIGDIGGLTLAVDKKGLIYAASDDNHLYIINPDGETISEFAGEGWLSWPVVAKDRMLIISDANNIVWAISDEACVNQAPVNINQKGKK